MWRSGSAVDLESRGRRFESFQTDHKYNGRPTSGPNTCLRRCEMVGWAAAAGFGSFPDTTKTTTNLLPSSSGLGYPPLTWITPVRIRLGAPFKSYRKFGHYASMDDRHQKVVYIYARMIYSKLIEFISWWRSGSAGVIVKS